MTILKTGQINKIHSWQRMEDFASSFQNMSWYPFWSGFGLGQNTPGMKKGNKGTTGPGAEAFDSTMEVS